MKQDQNYRYVGATISILEKISEKHDSAVTYSDESDQGSASFEDLLRDRLKSRPVRRQPTSMLSLSVTTGLPDEPSVSEIGQATLGPETPISLTSRFVCTVGAQAAALTLAAQNHQSSKQV